MKALLAVYDKQQATGEIMSMKRNAWASFRETIRKKVTKLSGSYVVDEQTGKPVTSVEFAHKTNCNIIWAVGRLLGAR